MSKIADIDSVYWFDDQTPATVRAVVEHLRLTHEVDPSYRIILSPDGRVMDGMHRVSLALLEGRSSISAVRLQVLPEPDFRNGHPDELPY